MSDDAISNLAKCPFIYIYIYIYIYIKNKERRHAEYCFKPGPSLYPENTLTKHR